MCDSVWVWVYARVHKRYLGIVAGDTQVIQVVCLFQLWDGDAVGRHDDWLLCVGSVRVLNFGGAREPQPLHARFVCLDSALKSRVGCGTPRSAVRGCCSGLHDSGRTFV